MKRLILAIGVGALAAVALLWLKPGLWPQASQFLAFDGRTQSPDGPRPKGKQGGSAPPVVAADVVLTDMPVILTAPGTVEPQATVAVKPRVDGQIAEVLFKEGDLVKAGQVLFRLDERLARAQIAQAEANVRRDQALLAEAEAAYARSSQLVSKKIVSESTQDTARSRVEALKAAISAGKAAIDAQKAQLDYLTISAPITGRTGSTTYEPGANIRAAETAPLVTINQTQPISVTFAVPQTELIALRRALAAGAKARVTVNGSKPATREGALAFIDNQVDRATGTLTAKILVPNEDELLWPGLAVDVALETEVVRDMPTVPVSAVLPSQNGMIVWVIGGDGKVQPRPVALSRVVGQMAYLGSGIRAGERVVADGHGRIAEGMTVRIQEPGSRQPADGPKGSAGDKNGTKGERGADGRRS
ncbi:MAG TPA: efflux RND transporter periplasmic adaptor subunit [Hyphomicrobiaceae bacterium]|nr:efflux RND transporter periplasmic adaptor subunit [Hyphomicrobiaceae bacterium]